jgi:hypothetical protein
LTAAYFIFTCRDLSYPWVTPVLFIVDFIVDGQHAFVELAVIILIR